MNIHKLKNSNNQIWLNVASSVYVLKNFVNLDNHIFIRFIPLYKILRFVLPQKYHKRLYEYYTANQTAMLLKHDCRKRIPLPDNSVDHILCSHFLEHVYPEDCIFILKDFKRVLKKDATLHIILPDIEVLIRQYLKNKENNIENAADIFIGESLLSKRNKGSLKYRILEFSGGFGLQHRWMYDKASITKIVNDFGFQILSGENNSPSADFRKGDDSIHILCKKI